MSEERPPYAGFWIRFGATLIDGILSMVITWPFLLWIYGKEYLTESDWRPSGVADVLLSYGFPAVATILFWRFKQATPGNMLTHTRVVDAGTSGALTTGQCVWRYCATYLSVLALGLGMLWIAWDEKKQAWHDKLAKTFVVHTRRGHTVP